MKTFLSSIEQQTAEGDVQQALDRLQNYLAAVDPRLRREALLYLSRYNQIRKEERKGLVTAEQTRVNLNRLTDAVLDFTSEVARKVRPDQAPVEGPEESIEKLHIPEDVGVEKIIGINNLKQISWVQQGVEVAQSVCRIITPRGYGTGFQVGFGLIMTNHHVIPTTSIVAASKVEFNYQQGEDGKHLLSFRYALDVGCFYANAGLDFAIVGVVEEKDKPDLANWGLLSLNPHANPTPGEHVIIIQHPNGGLKQIAMTANQVVSTRDHLIHYTTDTMPGSSGAPVFNDLWQVVAIHHAGGGLQVNAKGEKRFVNEGILMSAIKNDAGANWPQ